MNKKKFLIIDSRPFGLFSILLHTIDNIKWAEDNGYIPVIRWGPGRWNPNFMRPGINGNVKEKINMGHPIGGPITATNFFIPAEHEIFTSFAPAGFEETGYMGGIRECLYSENSNDNPWEYYFEPLNEYTVEDALNSEYLISDIFQMGSKELSFDINEQFLIASLNDYNPLVINNLLRMSSINHNKRNDSEIILQDHKKKVYDVLKNIRIKEEIKDKIIKFKKENFSSDYMLGVHIRGTDKAGERHEQNNFGLRFYLACIEQQLYKNPKLKIFLATDSQEVLDLLELLFSKDKMIFYPSYRMEKYNDTTPIHLSAAAGRERGEEALVETLLLSQCDHIIGSDSNMSMCPLYFSPNTKFTFVDPHTRRAFIQEEGVIGLGGA